MDILTTIIITILVVQFIGTIAFTIWGTDDITCIIGCGIWYFVFTFIAWSIRKIKLIYCRRYNRYQIFANTEEKTFLHEFWVTNIYMTPELANKHFKVIKKEDEIQSYCLRLLEEGKMFKSAPLRRDIIKTSPEFAEKLEKYGFTLNNICKWYKR